jgi:hypothetical protein
VDGYIAESSGRIRLKALITLVRDRDSDKGAIPPAKYKTSPIDLFSDYYLCQFDLLMACR